MPNEFTRHASAFTRAGVLCLVTTCGMVLFAAMYFAKGNKQPTAAPDVRYVTNDVPRYLTNDVIKEKVVERLVPAEIPLEYVVAYRAVWIQTTRDLSVRF